MPAKGWGKTGYCKICAHPESPRLITGARQGWNHTQALEVAKGYGLTFSRQTWYTHRDHSQSGDALVPIAPNKALVVKTSSSTEFLETVRDIGYSRAVQDPETVSIDHALKATQILEGRKAGVTDSLRVLIGIFTGHVPNVIPEDIVEGDAREV